VVGTALLVVLLLLVTISVSADTTLWKLVLVPIAFGIPGTVAAGRHPGNPVGWLLLGVSLLFGCSALGTQWVESGHLDAADWAIWFADRAAAALVPLTVLILVLVPDGHLPSPAWRVPVIVVLAVQSALVLVWALIAGPAASPDSEWPTDPDNPVGVLPTSWSGPLTQVGDWILQAPLLLGVAAVAVRMRRTEDRRRLAFLAIATGIFVLLVVIGHAWWPAATDILDVLGALLFAAALTVTLDGAATAESAPDVEAPELSDREQEVLALVAQGLTNKQIAAVLVISPITARNHVSNILTKIGLENRTQAAAWAETRRRDR
jgi:DNA-binding CsgD family transcriptional regulator